MAFYFELTTKVENNSTTAAVERVEVVERLEKPEESPYGDQLYGSKSITMFLLANTKTMTLKYET